MSAVRRRRLLTYAQSSLEVGASAGQLSALGDQVSA